MKRGGPQHPKVALLAADLGIPLPYAIGVLESLWHWADAYATAGDIGRYPPVAIAGGISWPGDPEQLVASLVRCRWLDETPEGLVLHDLHDHADRFTRRKLALRGQWFVTQRKPIRKSGARRATGGRRENAKNVPTEIRRNGVAERCVKPETQQQEGASPSTPLSAQSGTYSKPEAMLIEEINRVSGRAFKLVEANLKFARARLKDYSLAELVQMIRWRWKTWDEGMRAQWFRPETLLNATKCESYLGSMPAAERTGQRPVKPVNPELERIAARERELGMRS